MAMQVLHHDLDSSLRRESSNDAVVREPVAHAAEAYAKEVRSLRQRVAVLEAELAATRASSVPAGFAPVGATPVASSCSPAPASEFVQQTEPAVFTIASEVVPNPGFAQVWNGEDDDASFEERVAEKAFFQATTIDEESRSWLLEN